MNRNKSAIALTVLLLMLMCSGCARDSMPRIEVITTNWTWDTKTIYVGKTYSLNDSHPYDKVETKSGVDVIIHFNAPEKGA